MRIVRFILLLVMLMVFGVLWMVHHTFFEDRILKQLPVRPASMDAPPQDHPAMRWVFKRPWVRPWPHTEPPPLHLCEECPVAMGSSVPWSWPPRLCHVCVEHYPERFRFLPPPEDFTWEEGNP